MSRPRVARHLLALPALALTAALLVGGADRVEAQEVPRYGAGWLAGASHVTELNPDAVGTALEPGLGGIFAVHVDRWLGDSRRVGLRYQGAYQRPEFDWSPGERRIHTASGDLSLLLRVLDPADGHRLLPFVAGGLGGTWYDLGTGPETTFSAANALHDGGSRILLTGVIGAAVDIVTPWTWDRYPMRIRLEAADHITFDSPLHRIDDRDRYGAVHHFRFTIGAHTVFSY